MTPTLHPDLNHDLAAAYIQLGAARQALHTKDTPQHRAEVEAALDDVDAILDLYLETRD